MSETTAGKPQAPATAKPQTMEKTTAAAASSWAENLWEPMALFRQEMDRVFDRFWRGFGISAARPGQQLEADTQKLWRLPMPFSLSTPAIDVVETDKAWTITAELPGMTAKDIELTVSSDTLMLSGEKKEEREETAENVRISERRYGSFRRSFDLPRGAEVSRIDAKFEKGVLTVTVPKTAEAVESRKKIEVKDA